MKSNIKPMVYDAKLEPRVLMRGSKGGYDWVIVARENFPCAYVRIPEGHLLYGVHYYVLSHLRDDCDIKCHGDITWTGAFPDKSLVQTEDDAWWMGWDYGHGGDYCASFPDLGGKMWTTVEIMSHVNNVITQLCDTETQTTKEEV